MLPRKTNTALLQPNSDSESANILEKLIISENLIHKASKSAMESKAFTLSANLSYVRSKLLIEIYGIIYNRKELILQISHEAQQIYRESTDKYKTEDRQNAVTAENSNSR